MDDHGTGSTRPRRPEPSWPTVIATTVRLWLERHYDARRWMARARGVLAIVAVGLMLVAAALIITHRGPSDASAPVRAKVSGGGTTGALLAAMATQDQAAAWIAGQVGGAVIVACDPAMCAALQAAGLPADRLLVMRESATDPLGSDVVVATQAVRSQFGTRLGSVYAPLVIASFGAGDGRIDVRAVAPDGAAPYEASLAADSRARIRAGRQLAGNRRISVSAGARAELDTGKVDARLLMMLATLADEQPVRVVSFGDPSPGASPVVPLRGAEITAGGAHSGSGARLRSMLSLLDAQRPPFVPVQAGIEGESVLVEYSAPSPLGLLSGP